MTSNIEDDKSGSLVSHLVELRNRLLHSVVCVLLVFACMAYFANDIYTYVSAPLVEVMPEGANMIATDVASPFFAPFKLTFILAIFVSVPYILHQIWAFIAPGLYSHERKLVMPLLFSSTFLFYGGIAFAYYIVFPLVFGFFTQIAPEDIVISTDISSYLDFVLKLFFAFGLAFESPIAIMLLCWSGVTNPESLKEKRPYVVVSVFVLGMFLTPPDVISQTLLAIPMWLLFEVGLIFSAFYTKSEDENEVSDETDLSKETE